VGAPQVGALISWLEDRREKLAGKAGKEKAVVPPNKKSALRAGGISSAVKKNCQIEHWENKATKAKETHAHAHSLGERPGHAVEGENARKWEH